MDSESYESFLANKELIGEQHKGNREMYAPQMQEDIAKAQAVVIAETDPKKDVENLLYEFRGLRYKEGKLYRVGRPLINKLCADRLSIMLRSIMINSTRLGRLRTENVKKMTLNFVNNITDDLGNNWREYGITDRAVINYLIDSLTTIIYMILSRAEDQNEKNWLGRVTVESINQASKLQPKKGGGFWDSFKFKK